MRKATMITHQGWADHFSCNGLTNHYSKKFDSLTLFAIDENVATMLRSMYSDNERVSVIVPETVGHDQINFGSETCIVCHTTGTKFGCPRFGGPCRYIDYSIYNGHENIKVGAFKDFKDWSTFLSNSKKSFSHCFYNYESLPDHLRISDFHFADVPQIEKPSEEYFVLHDDVQRGFLIQRPSCNFVQLNQMSKIMIDTADIIKSSAQIHVIDSNYSVMIHLLSFHDQALAKIPKFLHASTRGARDIGIYTDPVPNEWRVL